MEERQPDKYFKVSGISVGMAELGLFIMIALLAIFFSGEPDLADAIIWKLFESSPQKQEIVWSQRVEPPNNGLNPTQKGGEEN